MRKSMQQLHLGMAHFEAKRFAEATEAYRCGIRDIEAGRNHAGPRALADLYTALGNASMAQDDLETAIASYETAHRLAPGLTDCLCGLATVHLKLGRPRDAIPMCHRILALDPTHWLARVNLAQAYRGLQDYARSKELLQGMAGERPDDALVSSQLGKVLYLLNEMPAALACFQRALALKPQDADSLYWLGNVRHAMGDREAAEADYARAARLQPLIKLPANRFPAELSVLMLFSPTSGNTPIEFLLKQSPYAATIVLALPTVDYDMPLLRGSGQVVFNLISEADRSRDLLPWAADLVDRLGKPTINHPRKVQQTTREEIMRLLGTIEGCRLPWITRLAAGAPRANAALEALLPVGFPVLARPVGTHGGDDFEKFDDVDSLETFLRQRRDVDHYLIEYVDYRSSDGYFRKYRCIFVDGEIFPYHLAVATHWKLHHITTDMINQDWMQAEEKAFLDAPARVLTPENFAALRAIEQAVGLDYFGIDFGLTQAGTIVVFEVNAAMLVHERADFPYAAPFVHRIKEAFDDMLRKRIAPQRSVSPADIERLLPGNHPSGKPACT